MRLAILVAFVGCSLMLSSSLSGQEDIPKSGEVRFSFETFKAHDGKLFALRMVPDLEAEPEEVDVQQVYTVMVPFVEEGIQKTRAETRTRLVTVQRTRTKRSLEEVGSDYRFQNVAGEPIELEKLIGDFGTEAKRIVVVSQGFTGFPDHWKEFLNPDMIIAIGPPPSPLKVGTVIE